MIEAKNLIPLVTFKKPLKRMWKASEKKLWAIEQEHGSEHNTFVVSVRESI